MWHAEVTFVQLVCGVPQYFDEPCSCPVPDLVALSEHNENQNTLVASKWQQLTGEVGKFISV